MLLVLLTYRNRHYVALCLLFCIWLRLGWRILEIRCVFVAWFPDSPIKTKLLLNSSMSFELALTIEVKTQ